LYFNAKRANFINRIKRSGRADYLDDIEVQGSSAPFFTKRIENWLKINVPAIGPSGLYMTAAIFLSVIFVPCLFMKYGIFIFIACAAVSVLLFYIFTDMRGRKISAKKEAQLEMFLIDLSGYLYTNPSILSGIQKAAEDAENPLKKDFDGVIEDTKKGLRLNEALQRMISKNRSRIIQIIITGLIAAYEKGADLSVFLKDQVDYIREKKSIENYIRILSSGPRYTSYIIALIPFAAILAASLINKSFAAALFGGAGLYILIYACASYLAGFAFINRIVNFSDKTDRILK